MNGRIKRGLVGLGVTFAMFLSLTLPAAASSSQSSTDEVDYSSVSATIDNQPLDVTVVDGVATASFTARPSGIGPLASNGSNIINCSISIDNPHQSGTPGFPHMWNVHAVVKCTGAGNGNVTSMWVKPDIRRNGILQSTAATVTAYNKNNVKQNAAAQCRYNETGDTWQGRATGRVFFPAGYTPSTVDLSIVSATRQQHWNCAAAA